MLPYKANNHEQLMSISFLYSKTQLQKKNDLLLTTNQKNVTQQKHPFYPNNHK
jgi:hypothetical protein